MEIDNNLMDAFYESLKVSIQEPVIKSPIISIEGVWKSIQTTPGQLGMIVAMTVRISISEEQLVLCASMADVIREHEIQSRAFVSVISWFGSLRKYFNK